MPPFLFNDMQEQTDYFLMRPLTKAKKMVIVSSNDMISPKKDIDDMIAAWNIQNVYNDAKHTKSIYKVDKIYGYGGKKISRKRKYASPDFEKVTIQSSPNFENVNAQICNKKLTIHCLSGGPCNYSRMLVQHPNLCKNVQFEVFDNPTSFNGLYNRYKILQGIPLSKNMQDQIDYIFKKPLTEAKKLIIVSSKDDISAGDAENLAAAWNVKMYGTTMQNICTPLKLTNPSTKKK